MPEPLTLELTAEQRNSLEAARDHHPKPYARERAAFLIKVADGYPAHWIAQHGLLKPRKADTVYRWYHRYRTEGIAALVIRPGCGRKPAHFP